MNSHMLPRGKKRLSRYWGPPQLYRPDLGARGALAGRGSVRRPCAAALIMVVQRLWNFVKRHRKKLIASGIIAGGIWYALRVYLPRAQQRMLNELMKALQESGSSSDDSKAQQSGRARFQENQLVSDDYARKGLRSYEPKHAGCFKIDKRQQEVKEAKGKDEKIIAFKALQEECLSLLASAVYSIHVNLLLHRIINNIAGREARGRLSQEGAGPTSKANGAMKIGEALMQKNMKELIDSTEYFLKEGPERMAAAARKAVKAAAEAVPLLPESTVNAESLSAFFVDVFNRMDQELAFFRTRDVWENQKGSSLLPPAQDDEKAKRELCLAIDLTHASESEADVEPSASLVQVLSVAVAASEAVCLPGVKFGVAPSVADWLRRKAEEMPEEDLAKEELLEALRKALDVRGDGPLRCWRSETAWERNARMRVLLSALSFPAQPRFQELARREAELKVQQLALEKQRWQASDDISGSHPIPSWLERNSDGTMNVAVVGNSGVGKSLLINKMRRIRPGVPDWAPTGVKETTLRPTAYSFPQLEKVRLPDARVISGEQEPAPGSGPGRPGLLRTATSVIWAFATSTLIVTAGRFTSIDEALRAELEACGVRTKIDLDVWNNKEDNQIDEDSTIESIRQELYRLHGVDHLYLVSSRDPDRYDMPALLADAFPGVRAHLEATSFLFTGGKGEFGDSWSSTVAGQVGVQGQWQDALENLLYIVDGTDVHITRDDGQTAIIQLTERDDKDGRRKSLDLPSTLLLTGCPHSWLRFLDNLVKRQTRLDCTRHTIPHLVSDGSVNLALLFGPCIHLANALLQDADGNGAGETATEATVRSFADHKAISDFCEQIYNQQPLAK
eukprot:s60_g23.t1